MLAHYLEVGDVTGAMAAFNDPNIHDMTIGDVVTNPDVTANGCMIGQILKIKKAKTKKPTTSNSTKYSKLDKPYDRLLMLR